MASRVNEGQARGLAPATVAAAVALAALANAVYLGRFVAYLWPFTARGGDFVWFWVAGRLAWAGRALAVYQPQAYTHAIRAIFPRLPAGVYSLAYPPPFLGLVWPLGGLSELGAFVAWMLVSLAVFAAALWAVRPRWSTLAAAPLAPGVALNLFFGQTGLLFGGLAGLVAALADRRPRTAGLALGLLALKPHVAAALGLVLLLAGRWRVLAVAAATAAALGLGSLAVGGAGLWRQYLAGLHQAVDLASPHLQGQSVRGSVYWTLLTLGAGSLAALAGQAAATVGAAVLAARTWLRRGEAERRVVVTLAALPLILPRLGTYDLAFLAVAAVCLAARRPWSAGRFGLALAFWLAPQLVQAAAFADIQILVPAALVLLAAGLRLTSAGPSACKDARIGQ